MTKRKAREANPREELLALAARLVIAADALERSPYEIESLRKDCLMAAEIIRLMEEDPMGAEATQLSPIHSQTCGIFANGRCTCATIIR